MSHNDHLLSVCNDTLEKETSRPLGRGLINLTYMQTFQVFDRYSVICLQCLCQGLLIVPRTRSCQVNVCVCVFAFVFSFLSLSRSLVLSYYFFHPWFTMRSVQHMFCLVVVSLFCRPFPFCICIISLSLSVSSFVVSVRSSAESQHGPSNNRKNKKSDSQNKNDPNRKDPFPAQNFIYAILIQNTITKNPQYFVVRFTHIRLVFQWSIVVLCLGFVL